MQRPTRVGQENGLAILKRMLEMRRFEEAVIDFAGQGERLGNFHVYIGQEGTGAAVLEATAADDFLLSTHRNHGHVIGRGADLGRGLAEILGRQTGLLGGRGGTLHLCDPSKAILQTSAIVGGSVSLATGAAFGISRSGGGRVAIGFFGDSALEEGVAYEALNLAALWKLPVIYVCENNSAGAQGLAGGGYPTLIHAASRLASIPEALAITTRVIADGGNVAAVYEAAADARRQCLDGHGPVFLEVLTERWPGSRTIIPTMATRTDIHVCLGEIDSDSPHRAWLEAHDPIRRWVRTLIAAGDASRDSIVALDSDVSRRIAAAIDFALNSPRPDPATVAERVYA